MNVRIGIVCLLGLVVAGPAWAQDDEDVDDMAGELITGGRHVPLELPDMPEEAVPPVEDEAPPEQDDTSTQPQQSQGGGSG